MQNDPLSLTSVQAQLAATRALVADIAAGQTSESLSAIPATPEWSALDILRHVEVWGELAVRCLDDWHGSRDWVLTFAADERFNVEMVAERAEWGLARVLDEIERIYDRYAGTLAMLTAEELAERAPAPWGDEVSRLGLIYWSLQHDQQHLGGVRASLH
jgi:hypothetical protein